MQWNEYKTAFNEAAKQNGKSKEYCKKYLSYAEKLWMRNMYMLRQTRQNGFTDNF